MIYTKSLFQFVVLPEKNCSEIFTPYLTDIFINFISLNVKIEQNLRLMKIEYEINKREIFYQYRELMWDLQEYSLYFRELIAKKENKFSFIKIKIPIRVNIEIRRIEGNNCCRQ